MGSEESIVCSTFSAILAEIARVPLKSATLLFNHKVVRISTVEKGVKIGVATGEDFDFDGVVLTTPLGWLKRNETAFEPRLPGALKEAITSISVGHLEKVFLHRSLAEAIPYN